MRNIYINTEGPCAKFSECCTAPAKADRQRWLGQDELYVSGEQSFIQVKVASPKDSNMYREYKQTMDLSKTYFMNCVTGTLFYEDGSPVSSRCMDNKVFVKDSVKGKEILFKKREY